METALSQFCVCAAVFSTIIWCNNVYLNHYIYYPGKRRSLECQRTCPHQYDCKTHSNTSIHSYLYHWITVYGYDIHNRHLLYINVNGCFQHWSYRLICCRSISEPKPRRNDIQKNPTALFYSFFCILCGYHYCCHRISQELICKHNIVNYYRKNQTSGELYHTKLPLCIYTIECK